MGLPINHTVGRNVSSFDKGLSSSKVTEDKKATTIIPRKVDVEALQKAQAQVYTPSKVTTNESQLSPLVIDEVSDGEEIQDFDGISLSLEDATKVLTEYGINIDKDEYLELVEKYVNFNSDFPKSISEESLARYCEAIEILVVDGDEESILNTSLATTFSLHVPEEGEITPSGSGVNRGEKIANPVLYSRSRKEFNMKLILLALINNAIEFSQKIKEQQSRSNLELAIMKKYISVIVNEGVMKLIVIETNKNKAAIKERFTGVMINGVFSLTSSGSDSLSATIFAAHPKLADLYDSNRSQKQFAGRLREVNSSMQGNTLDRGNLEAIQSKTNRQLGINLDSIEYFRSIEKTSFAETSSMSTVSDGVAEEFRAASDAASKAAHELTNAKLRVDKLTADRKEAYDKLNEASSAGADLVVFQGRIDDLDLEIKSANKALAELEQQKTNCDSEVNRISSIVKEAFEKDKQSDGKPKVLIDIENRVVFSRIGATTFEGVGFTETTLDKFKKQFNSVEIQPFPRLIGDDVKLFDVADLVKQQKSSQQLEALLDKGHVLLINLEGTQILKYRVNENTYTVAVKQVWSEGLDNNKYYKNNQITAEGIKELENHLRNSENPKHINPQDTTGLTDAASEAGKAINKLMREQVINPDGNLKEHAIKAKEVSTIIDLIKVGLPESIDISKVKINSIPIGNDSKFPAISVATPPEADPTPVLTTAQVTVVASTPDSLITGYIQNVDEMVKEMIDKGTPFVKGGTLAIDDSHQPIILAQLHDAGGKPTNKVVPISLQNLDDESLGLLRSKHKEFLASKSMVGQYNDLIMQTINSELYDLGDKYSAIELKILGGDANPKYSITQEQLRSSKELYDSFKGGLQKSYVNADEQSKHDATLLVAAQKFDKEALCEETMEQLNGVTKQSQDFSNLILEMQRNSANAIRIMSTSIQGNFEAKSAAITAVVQLLQASAENIKEMGQNSKEIDRNLQEQFAAAAQIDFVKLVSLLLASLRSVLSSRA